MFSLETLDVLVPGPASVGVSCLPANNNLDLVRIDGRLHLVWRTAPTHFASAEARLELVSAPGPAGPWRHDATVALGADVREPRFVVDGDRLVLCFMELGTDPKRFQPGGVWRMALPAGGAWSEPARWLGADIVPWRIRRLGGRWAMHTYSGGERMYGPRPLDPVVGIRWSDDLETWSEPDPIHVGGCECELVELPDGRVVGVTRNEGPSRRGGDLLVFPDVAHLDVAHAQVTPIPRKPDSPNLVLWGGEPVLFARRQVPFGGRYPHAPSWVPGAVAMRVDQAVWSLTRKRSSLYRIDLADPARPALRWELDLPSRGDTAFTAVVPEDDGSLLVADYRSSAERGDVMWLRGQLGPTEIVLHRLTKP